MRSAADPILGPFVSATTSDMEWVAITGYLLHLVSTSVSVFHGI